MNVMILSPGRRVDIVNYFKNALHKIGGEVYTLDMSNLSAALYEGDKYFVVKKNFDDLDKYIDDVIEICKVNNVDAVITLIDPELILLSKNKDKFIKEGIVPIVSDYEEINMTFDKYEFANKLKGLIPVIPTYDGYDMTVEAIKGQEIKFPLFAKIKNGSGSVGIGKISTEDELNSYKGKENYIFQPFVKNKEFGVDVYFDMISGEITSLFIKEKLNMRAGETDKAISIYREEIVQLILKLEELRFKGPIDVDIFEDFNEHLYVNEINPRFGGGYSHAYNSGVNFIEKIVNNLQGIENDKSIGDYDEDLVMLKYNGLKFINKKDLI